MSEVISKGRGEGEGLADFKEHGKEIRHGCDVSRTLLDHLPPRTSLRLLVLFQFFFSAPGSARMWVKILGESHFSFSVHRSATFILGLC